MASAAVAARLFPQILTTMGVLARRVPINWLLTLPALLLCAIGVAMVYSAGRTDVPTAATHAWRAQLVWIALALAAAWVVSRLSMRLIEWLALPLYAVAVFLLVLVLVPGFGSGGGPAASVKGWLTIAGHRIGQPAEFAKLALVLMLAKVLATGRTPTSLVDLWRPSVIAAIPWLLVMLEPELGTAIVFIGIFFGMLFWAGVEWRLLALLGSPVISLVFAVNTQLWGAWFLLLLALVIWYKPFVAEGVILVTLNVVMGVVAPIVWERMKPYQQNRLRVFLDPASDPRHAGYHVIQSQVAIGSGGWLGRGYLLGAQKRLAFLPEQHTDFIFAVVGEELGFIGVATILALFLWFFLRITRIAERANNPFASLVTFGLLSNWMVHVIENVGMTVNLVPVTGIPLPFFSYGGSFMLACWLGVGLVRRAAFERRGSTRA